MHSRSSVSFRVCLQALLATVPLAGCAPRQPPAPIATAVTTAAAPTALAAAAPALFFSEYVEGTSNNKALEIFNGTGAAIDLAAAGYNVQIFFNGSTSPGLTIDLIGTIASGDVFVLAHASASPAIRAEADQTTRAGWFNGDDVAVLRQGTTILDAIGQVGVDPGSAWGSAAISTADNTLRRKSAFCIGDADASDAFDPATEWDGLAVDTFNGLGRHDAGCDSSAPLVSNTTPADSATDVPVDASIGIEFSKPVDVSSGWFTISCTVSGMHTATANGGPTSFTLLLDADFASGESCMVTVLAGAVTDQDSNDPPDVMATDHVWRFTTRAPDVCQMSHTPAHVIQGSGSATTLSGQTVTTQGIVIGDYEGPSPALRGFYLQDPIGDGVAATSDGIFVFNGSNDNVQLGDIVRVTGTAQEFQDQTQVSSVTSIIACGSGASVTPVDLTLPLPSADHLERFEGMLVRLPQTLHVTEHFQLGRFGQVVLSSGGRLRQPTSVVAPGDSAVAMHAANQLNRIIVDDDGNEQNSDTIVFGRGGDPLTADNTLRAGDTAAGIVGVLTFGWAGNSASGNAYRVRPLNALGGGPPVFVAANPRPMTPAAVGGTLRVASLNVLNYFNTFSGCTGGTGGAAMDCRGADNATEFDRQSQKTVAAIVAMNADVIGVVEIENDGYGTTSALAELVDRLNDATAPGTFAFVDVDAATGQTNALGSDAIKVGLIFKPAAVTPVGTTAVLNTVAFVSGGDSGPRNRPSLAQAFEQSDGARFVISVNHFKSKGSACDVPDAGDGQGQCNVVRSNAANELMSWLATDPTGTADPDVLIVGDLNSYASEDPIAVLTGGGYTDLVAVQAGEGSYSYVFDGAWGYLDYALASASLAGQVTGVTEWHISADEPAVLDYNTDFKSADQRVSLFSPDQFRVSDHDPVIVGLTLQPQPVNDSSAAGPAAVPRR